MTGCFIYQYFSITALPRQHHIFDHLRKFSYFCGISIYKNKQQMIIVTKPIARQQLTDMAPEFFGDMVKAVVDIDIKTLSISL